MTARILTANRLSDGLVVYLGDARWTADVARARRAETEEAADELLAEGRRAIERNEVADAWLIDYEADRAVRRRERIRALGPTVRPDLGHQADAQSR